MRNSGSASSLKLIIKLSAEDCREELPWPSVFTVSLGASVSRDAPLIAPVSGSMALDEPELGTPPVVSVSDLLSLVAPV